VDDVAERLIKWYRATVLVSVTKTDNGRKKAV
jgi:hypothetical protein